MSLPKMQVSELKPDAQRWDPGKVFLASLLGALLICVGLPCAYWAWSVSKETEVEMRRLEQTDPLRFIAPCGGGR